MFEKFTERARKVMSLSRQEAQRLSAEFIGTEHILLGIIQEGGGVAGKVLKNLNVDLKHIRKELEKLITPSTSPWVMLGQLPFSPRCKRVIELAGEAAGQLGHDVLGSEHLLLGLLKEEKGHAAHALANLGLRLDEVRDMVLEVLGAEIESELERIEDSFPPSRQRMTRREIWSHERFRNLVDRPSLRHTVAQELLQRRIVALVGPRDAGKTSLAALLAESKPGGMAVHPIDYRFFDPFRNFELPERRGRRLVHFVADGEILTATGTSALERMLDLTGKGELLLLEFRDRGFEAFCDRFPVLSRELTPVRIDPPSPAETWTLLHAARTRLLEESELTVTDLVLQEANALAAELVPDLPAPWSTIQGLHAAAPIERTLRYPGSVREIDSEIEEQEERKRLAARAHRFEEASIARDRSKELKKKRDARLREINRSVNGSFLSIEAVRTALERLAEARREDPDG